MFIDALQYICPSRAVFQQMNAGKLSAVHITVGYHEDFMGVVENLKGWNRWFESSGSEDAARDLQGERALLRFRFAQTVGSFCSVGLLATPP